MVRSAQRYQTARGGFFGGVGLDLGAPPPFCPAPRNKPAEGTGLTIAVNSSTNVAGR